MPVGDVLPEIILVVGGVACVLLAAFIGQERQAWCAAIAGASSLGATVLSLMQLGDAPKLSFSGAWALDEAAIWARAIMAGATALVVPLVTRWLASDRRHGEYYALLLFSAGGAMLMAGAADLLQLSVAVLLSSITGYVLAGYHRAWSISVEAGMKYFLLGAFANALLMIGVTLVFGMLGDTRYDQIGQSMAPSALLSLGAVITFIGVAFKLGAVPVHAWMPDVAEGAPTPSAAFLTVVPKIGAAVALARLVHLFPARVVDLGTLAAALAVITMSFGNLAAMWQQDLRRLLGWSSVSQSGYALVAVALVGQAGKALPALLFFLLGYAAANIAAFAVVAHLRGRTAIEDYAGLWYARPWAATVLVLALLSLMGLPPLMGFVGKLNLFVVSLDAGALWLGLFLAGNTVLSLFYYLRVIGPIYFGQPRRNVALLGWPSAMTMMLAGAAVIGGGLGAGAILAWFADLSPFLPA